MVVVILEQTPDQVQPLLRRVPAQARATHTRLSRLGEGWLLELAEHSMQNGVGKAVCLKMTRQDP